MPIKEVHNPEPIQAELSITPKEANKHIKNVAIQEPNKKFSIIYLI